MKPHVENYMKAEGYCREDVIICEMCNEIAVDIHHIDYKSQGGTDEVKNLIALCRKHHDLAHAKKIEKPIMFEIVERRIAA